MAAVTFGSVPPLGNRAGARLPSSPWPGAFFVRHRAGSLRIESPWLRSTRGGRSVNPALFLECRVRFTFLMEAECFHQERSHSREVSDAGPAERADHDRTDTGELPDADVHPAVRGIPPGAEPPRHQHRHAAHRYQVAAVVAPDDAVSRCAILAAAAFPRIPVVGTRVRQCGRQAGQHCRQAKTSLTQAPQRDHVRMMTRARRKGKTTARRA